MGRYDTSIKLREIGVIDGKDITTESAVAKLMYLLNEHLSTTDFKNIFEKSLRGEMTDSITLNESDRKIIYSYSLNRLGFFFKVQYFFVTCHQKITIDIY